MNPKMKDFSDADPEEIGPEIDEPVEDIDEIFSKVRKRNFRLTSRL